MEAFIFFPQLLVSSLPVVCLYIMLSSSILRHNFSFMWSLRSFSAYISEINPRFLVARCFLMKVSHMFTGPTQATCLCVFVTGMT